MSPRFLNLTALMALGVAATGTAQALLLDRALFGEDNVQVALQGFFYHPSPLVEDGSACAPSTIRKNLKALNSTNVFTKIALTPTLTQHGSCYGPCAEQVEEARELHCHKAQVLADLANALGD